MPAACGACGRRCVTIRRWRAETAERKAIDTDGPPLAQIFKTVHAGHTGKLSYARIWRGTIKDGATLGGTRLGGIYRMPGGELAKIAEAVEGDLVALGRLDGVPTGATVSPGATPEQLPFPAAAAAGVLAGDRDIGSQGRCET